MQAIKLNDILKTVDGDLIQSGKEKAINHEIRAFKDEMGHPINLDERIVEMTDVLMHLDKGGYGPSKITEFEKRCKEIIETNKSKKLNNLRSIKDIDVLYKVLLKNMLIHLPRQTYNKLYINDCRGGPCVRPLLIIS